jgi:alpha-L-fucosidase
MTTPTGLTRRQSLRLLAGLPALGTLLVRAAESEARPAPAPGTVEGALERWVRTQAWRERRFGLFIHYGLFSTLGAPEHVLAERPVPVAEYRALAEKFLPAPDMMPRLARAARAAGMRYAVLTAKHADGFCLFESSQTDFNSARTAARRDLVAEYVAACRAEGLGVGLYYNQQSRLHPDCPIWPNDPTAVNAPRYTAFVHAQVRELLTRYGSIDQLWFDDAMPGWHGSDLRAAELVALCREVQPRMILSNRLVPGGSGLRAAAPPPEAGDFETPEQNIPPRQKVDAHGRALPWETCLTMNSHWSHVPADRDYKPAEQLIGALIECVSKGGNLLLNVGPDGDGTIATEEPILATVGAWLDRNGAAIHGCGPAAFSPPPRCLYTQRDDRLYAHLLQRGAGPVFFPGLAKQVTAVRYLADAMPVPFARDSLRAAYPDDLVLDLPPHPALPHPPVTVLEFTLRS